MGEKAVEDMVRIVPSYEKKFVITLLYEIVKGATAKGAWEITIPYGFDYYGLKTILFISFKISPPGRAGIQELRNHSCTSCPTCLLYTSDAADE